VIVIIKIYDEWNFSNLHVEQRKKYKKTDNLNYNQIITIPAIFQ